uniref:UBC core domain-containing protein n=1 Tax=Sinocyclocheilus rhinocerous TaxID=307959 RepID=A0A673FMT4_9TELE
MIKLFSLKQQKKDEESAGGTRAGAGGKKASAAQLRIQKDINELNLPKTCEMVFPDQDDLLNFKLIISPDELVSCGLCVSLLQEPNPEDPLNKEAAEVLQTNRRLFEQNVQRSLRGGYVGATYFERCLK